MAVGGDGGPLEGWGAVRGGGGGLAGAGKPASQAVFLLCHWGGDESFRGPEKGELLFGILGCSLPAENHLSLKAFSTEPSGEGTHGKMWCVGLSPSRPVSGRRSSFTALTSPSSC